MSDHHSDNHNDNGVIVTHTLLACMCELENSLRLSQTALLARDAAGIERCTREQERLWRALSELLANLALSAAMPVARESRRAKATGGSELAQRLRAAALRVQHLGRVQVALLRRSQHFLNVLANWMADPETPYHAPQTAAGGGSSFGAARARRGF